MPLSDDIMATEMVATYPDLFAICDRYEYASVSPETDLDAATYDAIWHLIDGGAMDEALTIIPNAHPGASKVRAELAKVGDPYLEIMLTLAAPVPPLPENAVGYAAAVRLIDEHGYLGDALDLIPDGPDAEVVRIHVTQYWLKVNNL